MSLHSWFIFDSGPVRARHGGRYKGDDVALEQCVYFYPDDMDEMSKKTAVGFSQALISFASMFSKDLPCEAVHLEKQRHAYLEVEEGLWIVMEANNPTFVADGSTQYIEDSFDDKALKAVLQQGYDAFRLFHGSMAGIYARGEPPPPGSYTPTGDGLLRASLAQFFDRWVPMVDLQRVDLFNTLSGINFLPVDKQIFLSIQYFVNLTESAFPQICASALLFDNQLVWSGVEQQVMRTIYKIATEPEPISAAKPSGGKGATHSGGSNIRKWVDGDNVVLHLGDGAPVRLCICERGQVLALFLVRDDGSDPAILPSLSDYVGGEAERLEKLITDNYTPQQGHEDHWRYLYFNEMNLALKSSMRSRKSAEISSEVMTTLNDMHAKLDDRDQNCTEICVKQQKEGWIVGRKSNERLLYAILESKGSTLAEISEDLDQLMHQCFGNIFM